MADRQFNPLGQENAPAGWTLPANLQLLLKQVYASFDGTGAAGPFIPCLELISDSGHTVGDYPASVTVAAGASADTTWFPRVSGGNTGTLSPDWGTYFVDSVLVSAGSQAPGKWHANAGTALLNIPGIGSPTFVSAGVYAVTCWVQSSDAWTAGASGGGFLSFGTPTSFEARAAGTADAAGNLHTFEVTLTAEVAASQSVDLEFANYDSAARNLYSNQVLVQLIGAY